MKDGDVFTIEFAAVTEKGNVTIMRKVRREYFEFEDDPIEEKKRRRETYPHAHRAHRHVRPETFAPPSVAMATWM